jgi:PPOX class probable F420-dependent enzyme
MNREADAGEFSELDRHEYITLITFRRDSSAVHTTVRFVAIGDYIYIQTPCRAGKTRRIEATGRVLVAPSNSDGAPLGRTRLGLGRVVEGKDAEAAGNALIGKYGQAHIDSLVEITREAQDWEIIEIRPWDE